MLKHFLSLLAICLVVVFALVPLRWAQGVGAWVGRTLYRKNKREARTTRTNLHHCFPELSADAREALALRSLEETGKTIIEMASCWAAPAWLSRRRICSVQGETVLQDAMARERGVILIAPHLGNWEVLNLYLSQHYDVTAMYKPSKWALMDRLIKRCRARTGTEMAPASRQGVKMVLRALRRSGLVVILPDQQPEPSGGVFAPFFGLPALSMTLLSKLAIDTGAMVVCGYARRLPEGRGFDVHFAAAQPGVNLPPLEASVEAMNATIEACAREIPEQYQWEYRRFGIRPCEDPAQFTYR